MQVAEKQGRGLMSKKEFPQKSLVSEGQVVIGVLAPRMWRDVCERECMAARLGPFGQLSFQPTTLPQAPIELRTQMPNMVAGDCVAKADELAV